MLRPPLPSERLAEIRSAIAHDLEVVGYCVEDEALTSPLIGLAGSVAEIPVHLLGLFDAAWNAGGLEGSVRWSMLLTDTSQRPVPASATELVDQFLTQMAAAQRAEQFVAAHAIRLHRHAVLVALAG